MQVMGFIGFATITNIIEDYLLAWEDINGIFKIGNN